MCQHIDMIQCQSMSLTEANLRLHSIAQHPVSNIHTLCSTACKLINSRQHSFHSYPLTPYPQGPTTTTVTFHIPKMVILMSEWTLWRYAMQHLVKPYKHMEAALLQASSLCKTLYHGPQQSLAARSGPGEEATILRSGHQHWAWRVSTLVA